MRVGLVIYGSIDTLSGGYLYDRKLVETLERAGDSVEIISIPWRSYGRHLTDSLRGSIRRALEGADVDIMLQDELNHPSLFRANHVIRGRVPIIAIVHHLRLSEMRAGWKNRAYGVIERRYLRSVDGYVFNSETTKRVVEKQIGKEKPNVVAYPAGDRFRTSMTNAQIRQRAAADGPLRVLFLGNVIERKQLHVLMEAMRLCDDSGVTADVVGGLDVEPDYVSKVRQQVANVGLNERVRFHGALGDDDLQRHLEQANVLAVPSSYEGFGIVYLEGMAFGLPAIATDSGAAHEIITDGQDGYVIQTGSAEELSHRLRGLAADRDLLARMGAQAVERFQRHPTWEQSMTSIRTFLVETVDRFHAAS